MLINVSATGNCRTIAEALACCAESSDDRCVVHIREGVYREKLAVTRPGVTLAGEGATHTRIVYGDSAHLPDESGAPLGTFRTATLRVSADDVVLRALTVENDAGPGDVVEQAVALHLAGDRALVENCRLLGHQDTLFIGPDRGKPQEPPRCDRRARLNACAIHGNFDFIFGSYRAWLEGCELYCIDRGKPVNAMIAAPNTPEGQPFGFVFHRCRVTGDCPPGTVYLGRPWRPFGRAAFIGCELPACVNPRGWLDWESPFRAVWEGLCESETPLAAQRHPRAKVLTEAEARAYTPAAVLDGWLG